MKKILTFSLISTFIIATGFFLKKNSSEELRTPSSIGQAKFSQTKIAQDLKLLKTITSVEEIQPVITKIISELESNQTQEHKKEAKFLASVFKLYLESQGLFDRIQPVLENNLLLSVGSVGALKSIKQNIPEHTKYLHALYDYFGIPKENAKTYQSIGEIQDEVSATLIPKLIKLQAQLSEQLQNYPAQNGPVNLFNIDLEALVDAAVKFIPEDLRTYKFTSAHLWAGKVELEKIISSAYYFTAYDLDDLGKLTANTSKKVSSLFLANQVSKTTPLKRSNKVGPHFIHENIRKNKFDKLFTLKEVVGPSHPLTEAKTWLIQSLQTQKLATICAKQYNPSNQMIQVQDSFIQKHASKQISFIEEAISNLEANGPVVFISPLNGKTFKVNPSVVFDVQNPQIKDLKLLLPTKHDQNTYTQLANKKVLNLNFGKAIEWSDPSFGGILPETQNSNLREKTYALGIYPATTILAHWLRLFQ